MKAKISIALLLVLSSLLLFQTASASSSWLQVNLSSFPPGTTIYVDLNNISGTEDGTSAFPYNTIQEGINAAASGDVVGVAPGTYYEKIAIKAGVQVVGTDATSTIVDGMRSGTVVTMSTNSLLKGFTIQNGAEYFGAGIVTSGTPKITNNIIRNNTQFAGGAGAAIHGNGSSPTITNNLIYGNTGDTQFSSGAISFINNSSPYIANNVIRNNTGRGAINLSLPTLNRAVVINNTIVNNTGAGIKVDARVSQALVLLANNISNGNTTGIQIDFGTSANWPVIINNDVFGNGTNYVGMADMTGMSANISADPLLSSDFHLTYWSPAIDAGSQTYYAATDFDGDIRPLDGNGDGFLYPDIGADERVYGDDIPPVITVTATKQDSSPYVADTWTNQTVTLKYTCSDAELGIASCPQDQIFSEDRVIPLVTGTATDNAGNSTSVSFGSIKIDKTPPALFVSVSPNPVLLKGNASLLTNANDALSGIKPGSMPCANIDTSSVGAKSTQCWVMDNAGNQTNTIAPYRVIYVFSGFLSPVIDCVNNSCSSYQISSFNAGSPVSLKFQLNDGNGKIVQPTTAPLWLTPVKLDSPPPVTYPENYSFPTTAETYTWKKSQNNYQYDWSTKKTQAKTFWRVGVKLDDGSTYYVFVYLK